MVVEERGQQMWQQRGKANMELPHKLLAKCLRDR